MNVAASIASPVSCAMRAIGSMSVASVRAAQFGGDRELRVHDLLRERERVRARARAGAGKPDVRGRDAELRHQVEQRLLVIDGRIGDGRRLQPIAQRLVVELHAARLPGKAGRARVPVVDELVFFHVGPNLTGSAGVDSRQCRAVRPWNVQGARGRRQCRAREHGTCAAASVAAIKRDGSLLRSSRAVGRAPSRRCARSTRRTRCRNARRADRGIRDRGSHRRRE